jgi:pilus assembly protein CpaD
MRSVPKLAAACLAGTLAISLAGCMNDTPNLSAAVPDDYHTRHPIVLTEAPTVLDVYPLGAGKLDSVSVKDVKAFATRYQEMGAGRIVILTPAPHPPGLGSSVDEIRRVLAASGVHGAIGLGSYQVADRFEVAPIKLSFRAVKAEVPSQCGQWPRDLASGTSLDTWNNRGYFNFGCATQSMLAAQVDDPRDFARSRATDPADESMRLRAIAAVRAGNDPGTAWSAKLTTIGQVGGN